MKIKGDFVTNSSSCSFVAWGVKMDEEQFKKQCGEKLFATKHVILGPDIVNKTREEFFEDDFLWNAMQITQEFFNIDISSQDYDDELYIGQSPEHMKDDETALEFKTSISNNLKKMGIDIEPSKLQWIEEAWHD